jgi:hypothetical protein
VPKRGECDNIFVTFALSASHSAFASLRMEPVLMITSQSAATGAVLSGPCTDGIPTFPVRVINGVVYIGARQAAPDSETA